MHVGVGHALMLHASTWTGPPVVGGAWPGSRLQNDGYLFPSIRCSSYPGPLAGLSCILVVSDFLIRSKNTAKASLTWVASFKPRLMIAACCIACFVGPIVRALRLNRSSLSWLQVRRPISQLHGVFPAQRSKSCLYGLPQTPPEFWLFVYPALYLVGSPLSRSISIVGIQQSLMYEALSDEVRYPRSMF